MPTVATGLRSTLTGIKSDRLIVEMQDEIYQYDPSKTPMLTFLSQSSGSKASNPTFNHLEDEPLPAWTTTAEDMDTTETGMDVASGTGKYFRAGDLILCPTASAGGKPEVMLATAISTDTVTVIRDWVNNNSGTGGTSTSGCNVLIIGNVNVEGSGTRTLLQTTEALVTNYTQIIKTPWGVTGTLDATSTYGGPDRVTQAKKAATQHALEQERAFLYGTKRSTTDGATFTNTGRAIRSTGGILYWLSTNSVNVAGSLTHASVESLAEKVFRYGSDTKVLLCSRRVMSQLDNIAEARIETVPLADTYGVKMRRYVTGHGDFLIRIHDMLDHDYAGYAIAVDMTQVTKRFTVNSEGKRDALLRMNIQNPDADAVQSEYLSEVGLHIHLEKTHGWLYGVT